MSGRHKIRDTKDAWRERADRLAGDLARSEQVREDLLRNRNQLLEELRNLSRALSTLQRELGTECLTAPVPVVASEGPVYRLKPPGTGRIPVQGPSGERLAIPVRGTVSRPPAGRTRGSRPTWATG